MVGKFDDWTQRELNLGRFRLAIVLRERKGIEGILNLIVLLFKNTDSGYQSESKTGCHNSRGEMWC